MRIKKAVITAAGLGTRLLPTTKELPKEMLPIFSKSKEGNLILKPILQLIFEQLFNLGIREFCFIVGRGKRAIEDHFTPDYDFLEYLKDKGKEEYYRELKDFYEKIEKSYIFWINQPYPRGFGDAVFRAKGFVGDDPFILYAGDTYISNEKYVDSLINYYLKYISDAFLLATCVDDPRPYGVIEGYEVEKYIFKVSDIVEKPKHPRSNIISVGVYIFDNIIFKSLKNVKEDESGEIQLTDAIRKLINWDLDVYAYIMDEKHRIDIGNVKNYKDALDATYSQTNLE